MCTLSIVNLNIHMISFTFLQLRQAYIVLYTNNIHIVSMHACLQRKKSLATRPRAVLEEHDAFRGLFACVNYHNHVLNMLVWFITMMSHTLLCCLESEGLVFG